MTTRACTLLNRGHSVLAPTHEDEGRTVIRLPSKTSLDESFMVTHELGSHPLFTVEAVRDLARRLPAGSAEPSPTDTSASGDGASGNALVAAGGLGYEPAPMVDAGPALAALEGRRESLYLHNIERDAQVGSVALDLLGRLYPALGVAPADVTTEEAYLFLTGGPATTSTHVDHELNFLLVLRGHKRVFVADVPSPEAEVALEMMYSGGYGTCAAVPEQGREFEVGPGEGIFIPPRAAHYVVNGDEPCAALSIVFGTAALDRESEIYRANALLRRVGLTPEPPGAGPVRDRMKVGSVRTLRAARRILPGPHDRSK